MRIIAGDFGGRVLKAPRGNTTRPTTDRSREALFSALSHQLGHDFSGLRVLDLFAGSGALGLEALSRGAAHATFVERAAPAAQTIKDNAEALGVSRQISAIKANAMHVTLEPPVYDLVFTDPPYDQKLAARSIIKCAEAGFTEADALFCGDCDPADAQDFEDRRFDVLWSKRVSSSFLIICTFTLQI